MEGGSVFVYPNGKVMNAEEIDRKRKEKEMDALDVFVEQNDHRFEQRNQSRRSILRKAFGNLKMRQSIPLIPRRQTISNTYNPTSLSNSVRRWSSMPTKNDGCL